MAEYITILGAIFLVFRIWLVEGKLKRDLNINRAHISRILSYYFGIAMLLQFQSNIFTFLVIVCMPGMFMAVLVFDLPYYLHFGKIEAQSMNKGWLIIERLTLHLPLLFYALYFYSTTNKTFFYSLFSIPNIIIGILLVVIPFFSMDPRWTIKQDAPRGWWILIAAILSLLGIFGYYYILVHYWNGPNPLYVLFS